MKTIFSVTVAALAMCLSASAADLISDTAMWAFGDLLLDRNATSKGWNFGNTAANAPTVTLLGVTFIGNTGASDATTGLTYTTSPLTYAIAGFVWTGAPEQAARDSLSRGGLHGGTGNFAMRFATTPGKTYILEIVALDASAASGRSMDIIVDNVTVLDDWFIPVGSPYNRLARIRVVADADGLDLRMGRGGRAGTDQNPAISAIALTEETPGPPTISLQPCTQSQPLGGSATFTIGAGGVPTPTLQWRKNTVPIDGQTSPTLTLSNLTAADAAGYDVVVTNSNGSVTSNTATLTIVPIMASTPLTAGMMGYWRFDEAAGCSAADSSGQHHSGWLYNFPIGSESHWSPGIVGNSLTFGGPASLQHVIVRNVPRPTTPAYTLSAWVYAEARPVWASIAKNWFGFMHFGLDSTGGQLSNYFGTSSGQPRAIESQIFPTGSWQHVVCTVDGSTIKLFRNGALTASAAWSGTMFSPLPVDMGIGVKLNGSVADTGAPGYWQGKIDEMGLWHRALSDAEVNLLYTAGVQGQGIDTVTTPAQVPALVINEYMPDNSGFIQDEDFDSPDWIELFNGTAAAINLNGYYLTDNLAEKKKWRFPAVTLPAGGYLLVWASEKDRAIAGQPLHTNFKLDPDGEDLALIAPDGNTIVHAYTSPLIATNGAQWRPVPTNISFGITETVTQTGYYSFPTANGPNGGRTNPKGALISQVTHAPPVPNPGQAIHVTAKLLADQDQAPGDPLNTVSSVTLRWRVMFGPEQTAPMFDDGLNGDGAAGDGVYGGTIPAANGATAGQMIRWAVAAVTAHGATSRSPQFLSADAPEYHGTIVADGVTTLLPVFHRFVEFPASADTDAGTWCSIYFNGEFHDRCRIRIRGNTSRSWPKKSHKIDLPPGRRVPLRLAPPDQPEPPEVSELNLNTTYTDKSYVRALLTAEMHALTGIASPEIFHIHQRENGAFYSVALCTENVDDIFLKKHGIDDLGAVYKAVGDTGACDFTSATAFEKKNRGSEGYTDLQAVVTSLGLTGTALETWLFDNIDVPSWVNWHAGSVISQNIDASNKNFYIHRDTRGSLEWTVIPWDLDLTFGPNALNTDTIVYNQSTPSTPQCPSHPLIGARPWQLHSNKFNRMIEALAQTPRTRLMIARRIRSLNDQFLATNWFNTRMDALEPILTADVNTDHTKWGTNSHFAWSGGTAYALAQSISRIKTLHLASRSAYLMTTHGGAYSLNFSTGAGSLGVPASQPAAPTIQFGAIVANPPGGNQDQEYIELQNPGAIDVDMSGWTLEGGVSLTLKGGTVLPAGESLFLTPNSRAFRLRATSPTGGERRFVQGNYSGHLNNFGEMLVLKNIAGTTIASVTLPPNPSDPQKWLVVSELNYNPPGSDDSTEFVELLNTSPSTTLDLAGVHFTAGIDFTFAAGTTLTPGNRLLVVKDLAAFQAAYPAVPAAQIAGVFTAPSALDNGGELLKLEDATNSTIEEFTWNDVAPWPTTPDGDGPSLVLIAPQPGSAYAQVPQHWRPSVAAGGTPGTTDATTFTGNAAADIDGDGLNALIEYKLGTSDNAPTVLGALISLVRDPINVGSYLFTFQRALAADDVALTVQTSTDLANWIDDTNVPIGVATNGATQTVVHRLTAPAGAAKFFARLRVTK